VFWQVGSSATIGGNSVFKGNILADQSITMGTGAILDGRALARNGEVALDANTITVPDAATASVILVSAGEVTDPFTRAPGHFVNLEARTITVPLSADGQFYRIQSATALNLSDISFIGGSVVITYE
ncbi:MAG TPA: ice-binding family protein, partial [Methylomirabilota bacterium]|nr:ice-binding family protein [Methylomirabilota bacterium]